jgi:hypothetical protein
MLKQLEARGVNATAFDGLNVWIEVHDERSAVVALASSGIAVGAPT